MKKYCLHTRFITSRPCINISGLLFVTLQGHLKQQRWNTQQKIQQLTWKVCTSSLIKNIVRYDVSRSCLSPLSPRRIDDTAYALSLRVPVRNFAVSKIHATGYTKYVKKCEEPRFFCAYFHDMYDFTRLMRAIVCREIDLCQNFSAKSS